MPPAGIRKPRRPTAKTIAKSVLAAQGITAVDNSIAIPVPRGRHTGMVTPHLYLPDERVFVFAVKHDSTRTKSRESHQLRANMESAKRHVAELRNIGYGAIYLSGFDLRQLNSSDCEVAGAALERFRDMVSAQARLADRQAYQIQRQLRRERRSIRRRERTQGRQRLQVAPAT